MKTADLLESLSGDDRRKANDFSPDFYEACKVILNPYARDDEKELALRAWLFKYQPCVFGRLAANADRLYIVVLDDSDLQSDESDFERMTGCRAINLEENVPRW